MPTNTLIPLALGVLVVLVALSGIRFIPNNRIGIVEKPRWFALPDAHPIPGAH